MTHSHSGDCVCLVCTCGRHKSLCKPVQLSDAPMDGHTEYNDHFLAYPTSVVRGKPAQQELKVGGEFYSSTESRDQFIVKPEYIPNKAKLESLTTQRENYQAWPGVTPPKRRQQPKWSSTSGTFDGTTTSKTDFVVMELPPHFQRVQQPYMRGEGKMDGISTQSSDYRPWAVVSAPVRRKGAVAPPLPLEDRDFKSTSIASYVGHNQVRLLAKAPPNLTTDMGVKFEGISTAKAAYQHPTMPARYQRHRAEYKPSESAFDGTTTYNNAFVPKNAARYVHPAPVYVPNPAKFEAQSTNKTDYLTPQSPVRTVDFSPRAVYMASKDDRDFLSSTQAQHTPKRLPGCAVSGWTEGERERGKDGHVHLKRVEV